MLDIDLFEEFKKLMISNEDLYNMVTAKVLREHGFSKTEYPLHFSELVEEIEKKVYDRYLVEESKAGEKVLSKFIQMQGASGIFNILDRFYLSLAQSRKSRAGKAFEEIIKALFKKCSYPFDEQRVINGKPDFLMPSHDYFKKNAPQCIIFTAKRTLRERWRQIATEGVRGLGFFLATTDAKVTEEQAREMLENRIHMVVPKKLKNDIAHYGTAPNIISFEDFFSDYLDPAMKRWKKAGVA